MPEALLNKASFAEEIDMKRAVTAVIAAGAISLWLWPKLEPPGVEDVRAEAWRAVTDALAQYDSAKHSGAAMEACMQAGFLASAYRIAGDEAKYLSWKRVEAADCASAGYSNAGSGGAIAVPREEPVPNPPARK